MEMEVRDPFSQRAASQRRGNVPADQVYDSLTGLPGRKAAFAMLARAVSLARSCNRGVLTALVDMDRFYLINETRGTAFGDEALRQMANRLCELTHWSGSVFRLSGNAFLLFRLVKMDDASIESDKLIEELKKTAEDWLEVRGQNLQPFCSIGVSSYPADGETAERLVRHAETALQQAKAAGGNQVVVYAEDGAAQILRTEAIRIALRTVLQSDELSLYYQPLYEVHGRLRGFEALLRWQHPQLGLIMPEEFVPLAELNGQIVDIGEWVIREACGMLNRTGARGLTNMIISVNLSPNQLVSPDFVRSLQRILEDTATSAAGLEIEITERSMIDCGEKACAVLGQLRDLGIRIALDDFGIGYASLTYLRKLPLHTLKLETSYIRHICDQHADSAIVKALIALMHELGLEVVAEGVEHEGQLELLKQWGCDFYQGYLLGMPMQEEAIGTHLLQLQSV
ncbi:bifunctional diguanylate cyclase/phosphodiesterase [Paenibacillus sp. DLE-14]|uniref:Bifunctional diguanylate cyclase/phosphodiesterase n=2 Tax=Paenibacillus lignilyticus TaxID=1172615 RepID=A0ABS5CKK2_9BACL|nr:bifunctional diguanylate cyclase/phosphodiesterase [Paenibacillus lignilyticus]